MVAALNPAGGDVVRPRNLIATGTALVCSGATMLFGALMAAYIQLRSQADAWPPKGVKLDNYFNNMLVITMLLGSVSVGWAVSAVKRGERRQAVAAFAITMGFGVAFGNLLSYAASQAGFGANDHPYGIVLAALGATLALVVALAVGASLLTMLRVKGSQVGPDNPDQAQAAAWLWHYATLATIVVWFVVVVRN